MLPLDAAPARHPAACRNAATATRPPSPGKTGGSLQQRSFPMKTQELLEILACPRCLGTLEIVGDAEEPEGFLCPACAVVYPVRDGIPVMLAEEAVPRDQWTKGGRN